MRNRPPLDGDEHVGGMHCKSCTRCSKRTWSTLNKVVSAGTQNFFNFKKMKKEEKKHHSVLSVIYSNSSFVNRCTR